jgi:hypothetical protein
MLPSNDVPTIKIPHFDKIIHFGLYFMFSFLLYKSFVELRLIIALSISYGAIIEFLQDVLTTSRSFDWLDILANSFGVTFFIIFVLILEHSKTNK